MFFRLTGGSDQVSPSDCGSSGAVGPQYQPKSAALAHRALPCPAWMASGAAVTLSSGFFQLRWAAAPAGTGEKGIPVCAPFRSPLFFSENSKTKDGNRGDCVFQQEGCPAAERLKSQHFKCAFWQNEIHFILIFRCVSFKRRKIAFEVLVFLSEIRWTSFLWVDTASSAFVLGFWVRAIKAFAHVVQPSGKRSGFFFLLYAPTKKDRIKASPSGTVRRGDFRAPGLRFLLLWRWNARSRFWKQI